MYGTYLRGTIEDLLTDELYTQLYCSDTRMSDDGFIVQVKEGVVV